MDVIKYDVPHGFLNEVGLALFVLDVLKALADVFYYDCNGTLTGLLSTNYVSLRRFDSTMCLVLTTILGYILAVELVLLFDE